MSRFPDLSRRATARRPRRPPLALTHPVGSTRVLVALPGVAAVLVGALWVLESWLLEGPLGGLDRGALAWVADQRTDAGVAVAHAADLLGEVWMVVLVGVALGLVARRRSGRWDTAQLAATVVVGPLATATAAKVLTARLRPDDALTSTMSLAFPSGHAARSAAVYGLVAWLAIRWARHPVTRLAVTVLATATILVTGWSRVLLGAHWPTDVLAGWGLGIAWLTAVLLLTRPAPVAAGDGAGPHGPPHRTGPPG